MNTDEDRFGNERWSWDWLVIKFVDVPWGYLIFFGLALYGALKINSTSFTVNDYLKALATGAGLLGLGHGVHTAAKVRAGEDRAIADKAHAATDEQKDPERDAE
jgi:hypothetical protein